MATSRYAMRDTGDRSAVAPELTLSESTTRSSRVPVSSGPEAEDPFFDVSRLTASINHLGRKTRGAELSPEG